MVAISLNALKRASCSFQRKCYLFFIEISTKMSSDKFKVYAISGYSNKKKSVLKITSPI